MVLTDIDQMSKVGIQLNAGLSFDEGCFPKILEPAFGAFHTVQRSMTAIGVRHYRALYVVCSDNEEIPKYKSWTVKHRWTIKESGQSQEILGRWSVACASQELEGCLTINTHTVSRKLIT